MNWILLAIVSGSILTSSHDTKEACLGRAAILHEQKIEAKCVEAPRPMALITEGSIICGGPGGVCLTR